MRLTTFILALELVRALTRKMLSAFALTTCYLHFILFLSSLRDISQVLAKFSSLLLRSTKSIIFPHFIDRHKSFMIALLSLPYKNFLFENCSSYHAKQVALSV